MAKLELRAGAKAICLTQIPMALTPWFGNSGVLPIRIPFPPLRSLSARRRTRHRLLGQEEEITLWHISGCEAVWIGAFSRPFRSLLFFKSSKFLFHKEL